MPINPHFRTVPLAFENGGSATFGAAKYVPVVKNIPVVVSTIKRPSSAYLGISK